MNDAEINELFTYQNSSHIDPVRFEEIREAAKELAKKINLHGGWADDKKRALQNLRVTVFFAIASICFEHKEDSEGDPE